MKIKFNYTTYVTHLIHCICFTFTFCNSTGDSFETVQYISTGGIKDGRNLCPASVNDVIVPIKSLNPKPSEGTPEMKVESIITFMKKNNINSINDLTNVLPEHYKTNFSLVEKTKGEGKASLEYPRIVLFGSDGRFLMNISTKPNDPKYDLLDCAELNSITGLWEFSQLDFTSNEVKLHKNPKSCLRCHGKTPRPIWGSNMDWPGVFGDNEAAGLNGEALSPRHAITMNKIRKKPSYSDRFNFLLWSEKRLTSGGFRHIANNAFGVELLVSNLAIGSAHARGVFLRLKNTFPKRYLMLREVLLLLGYEHTHKGTLTASEKMKINNIIYKYGEKTKGIDGLLKILGVDANIAFSLGTIAQDETPRKNWSLGAGDIYDQILLQVLDHLYKDDKAIERILTCTANTSKIFGCNDLGKTVKDVIDYKMLHLFHLQGSARYEVNKVFYPQDVENIKEKVLSPILNKIIPYLKTKAAI